MNISLRNLKDTCQHIVNSYRFNRYSEEQAVNRLSGLSLLLVGYHEKRFVDDALDQVSDLSISRSLAPAARSVSADSQIEKGASQ